MNETQKNWRKAWEDYEPTETDRIYRQTRKPRRNNSKVPMIIAAIVAFLLTTGGVYFNNHQQSTAPTSSDLPIDMEHHESNKDGVVMEAGIKKVTTIFEGLADRIGDIRDEELNAYIDNINKLELSEEYSQFIEQSIVKLNKAKEFNELYKKVKKAKSNKEFKKLKKEFETVQKEYNDIDIIKYLAKAFDQSGVKYEWRDDGGIIYNIVE